MRMFNPVFFPLIFLTFFCACQSGSTLFHPVPSGKSGIHFNNLITENDSINPIDITNLYNGGGVGVGDFNGDGLLDVYFTGNLVANALYLNKGNLVFEDIASVAGVEGQGRWSRGVAVVDINNDDRLDLYVCASMLGDGEKRRNLLYINQGNNNEGIPVFKEMAAGYGLDDSTHSTMAAFFDYDNDGDLDMYLLVNEIVSSVNPSVFKQKVTDGSFPSTGKLYRHDIDSISGETFFRNVTQEAGLTIEGYGHGVNITDINKDGWKDIFISNDFIANDLLYINNHDGTFTDKSNIYFKHTAANGMGQDVIDINNDGLSDIIELDMNPQDNYRKKMMLNPGNYRIYQLNDFFKYQYQYVRNSLQINRGPRVNDGDSIGDPVFSDIGYFSGIAETDWSWTPLVADFDNDGYRDIIVTNGFPRDVTDHDFLAFREQPTQIADKSHMLKQIPEVKLHNYAFRNGGNCRFTDVSTQWGLTAATFSNGAAYADLDNDGDLDLLVNNINDEASLYENTTRKENRPAANYLQFILKGASPNTQALGAWIELYYGDSMQVYEQTAYRGYLSTVQPNPYFGLGSRSTIDSVVIKWPGGKISTLKDVVANQVVTVAEQSATATYNWQPSLHVKNNWFKDITREAGIDYVHMQRDIIDFNLQKSLHHKLSEYGPSIAAGDINGDGLDDLIVGGNSTYGATALLQQKNGNFERRPLTMPDETPGITFQDMGMLLMDADGDGDLDLYLARGGYESQANSPAYQDLFMVNNGQGQFVADSLAIPVNLTSKSCVRAVDYDQDGDLDLFIAGRVDPWHFPKPVSSFIYRNDSKNGQIRFTDVTRAIAPELTDIGMVCDAVFTDFDNDGWQDLVLAGEWMPVCFFKNEKGRFRNLSALSGIADQQGWWTSIAPGDFDNDGDIDYIVGNLGLNSFYRADSAHPVSVYAKDFDRNGTYDMFLSLFLPTSHADTTRREYPAHLRDDMIRQMISMRAKFVDYKSFARATMDSVLSKEQLKGALITRANYFSSALCRNDGGGKFSLHPLPMEAQWSALNGMVVDDFDGDGYLDVAINTNDYGNEVLVGRYDAMNGLLLKGRGDGSFAPQSMLTSGLFIPGNGKAMVKLRGVKAACYIAATQNRGPLKLYASKKTNQHLLLQPNDKYVELLQEDGKKQKVENYYGSSFLSQQVNLITIPKQVKEIIITNNQGQKRLLQPDR